MSKVTVQIGFYLEGEHYAQMQAFLPRVEALKIPELKIDQRIVEQKIPETKAKRGPGRLPKSQVSKSQKSQSKKMESQDDQMQDQEDNINEMQNEQQQEQQQEDDDQMMQDQPVEEDKIDSSKEEENLMRYLQEEQDSDDDDLEDEDLSSISRSMSVIRNNPKTKRQKGERGGLMELPDRRPRKDKKFDEATQLIRRQEKERKRKQYLKKQVEAQQKATLDKILNQTGRKLKQREEKQNQQEKKKEQKAFKTLGEVPKIILVDNNQGNLVILHNTKLFPESMTKTPQLKQKNNCSKCGKQDGRYKIKNSNNYACSLDCYKVLV